MVMHKIKLVTNWAVRCALLVLPLFCSQYDLFSQVELKGEYTFTDHATSQEWVFENEHYFLKQSTGIEGRLLMSKGYYLISSDTLLLFYTPFDLELNSKAEIQRLESFGKDSTGINIKVVDINGSIIKGANVVFMDSANEIIEAEVTSSKGTVDDFWRLCWIKSSRSIGNRMSGLSSLRRSRFA